MLNHPIFYALFGLFWYKLLELVFHLNVEPPTDPTTIPYDVRVFWAAPFTTPTWEKEIAPRFGLNLILFIPMVIASLYFSLKVKRGQENNAL